MKFDHLAVAGETLEEAAAHLEEALGVALLLGGKHARFGTHNKVLGLADGLYLEAIAVDPEAQDFLEPRWLNLDKYQGKPRLNGWICSVDDLDTVLAEKPLDLGGPVTLSRGDLRWTMAVREDALLPFDGMFPTLMQWHVDVPPTASLPDSGCRLTRFEVAHPEAEALGAALGLQDDRVVFVTGEQALRATFETPHGVRVLE